MAEWLQDFQTFFFVKMVFLIDGELDPKKSVQHVTCIYFYIFLDQLSLHLSLYTLLMDQSGFVPISFLFVSLLVSI